MNWRVIMGRSSAAWSTPQYPQNPHNPPKNTTSENIGNIEDGTSTRAPISAAVEPSAPDDDWMERIALTEYDGGLDRSDAEAVASISHPGALPEEEPSVWSEWFSAEVETRTPSMGRGAATRRVWGMALNLYHRLHGNRAGQGQCAGCGKSVGRGRGFALPDETVVHDDHRFANCLIAYGRSWRRTAAEGLEALGLVKPEGVDDE
ncbi:MAG TPA: hypothetical protein VD978_37090 [Azospirillum sp.]|nr:hypothetical protein [Azospirillum sp.]